MAKREPRWAAVFLKQLEQTGNVRLAAERAGVDFTTAYQRRKRHSDFAERWEGALAAVALRQGQEEGDGEEAHTPEIPSTIFGGPPPRDKLGEETVLRPDGKVARVGEGRWSKRSEEAFLVELTATGSVRMAARAAGFSTAALYKRRLKDRHFCAAWDAAVEAGKARVQAYLVEAATRTFDPDELPIADDREIEKVSISEAINIAKMPVRGPATTSGGKGFGMEGRTYDETGFDTTPITREEWEEARQRIIDRLERMRERDEELERETGCCISCGQRLPAPSALGDDAG
jgi:hypothetical protein